MKHFAFIGLGPLAMSMLESVSEVTDQIVVIDKDPSLIDRVKDLVKTAYVADINAEEAFRKTIPESLDIAVVDIPGDREATLLVTHRLAQMEVPEIIVKSETDELSQLLKVVGATRIVNADREAAARIVPLMLSTALYNFMPIGGDLVMAEVHVPKEIVGKTLVEADLRSSQGVNVIAIRSEASQSYRSFDRSYRLAEDDLLLLAGIESDVFTFAGVPQGIATAPAERKGKLVGMFKRMFRPGKKKS